MKTTRIALFAAAALTLAGGAATLPAFAQPAAPAPSAPGASPDDHGPRHGMMMHRRGGGGFALGEAFARADANADSRVTREEGWNWLQARFGEFDANRDGGVTQEELRSQWQARSGRQAPPADSPRAQRGAGMFRALDVNSDDRVTLEELRPFAEAMFRARDANQDGALTREEVMPARFHRHGQPAPQQRSN
jgi:hypothetical protein